ncbi:type II secretion system secretin GspD [Gilvimarinus sp. F26214L]|uniref:type II secretion system secretin GspD n=1 Tax=Gilvimarinus sp. DZF01 TaxID=3461371 RepID=UPI004045AA46
MTYWQRLLLLAVLFSVCGSALGQNQTNQDPAQQSTWTPNFNNTDILEVIRAVQDATGKTIVVDPRVKGTITVMTDNPVDQDTYYEIFLRALDVNGFTAVERSDGVVTIVPTNQVRSESLPFAGAQTGVNNYVTEVIPLNNVAAAQVLPAIRPLVSTGNAQMTAYPPSNVLILVDTVANVERIRQLVERIDQAATPETELVGLEYAEAEEMVRMLREIVREDAGAGQGGGSTQLQLVADKRTNSVLVTGEQRQRERIKDLISRLDLPQPQTGNARVIYLEYASAANVAERLTNVVQNMAKLNPDQAADQTAEAAIEADEDTNSLIITADIDTVNSLQGIIERLDIQRAQVLVEAIIVEINDDIGKNLGIQWLFRHEDGGFAGSFDAGNNPQAIAQIAESALETDDEDALTGLAGALAGMAGQTFGVGRLTDGNDLLALIDVLQATSGANILSTPNLLTTDNTPARITVGESVPFVTGSFTSTGDTSSVQNPFQTINRENVGTTLEVTPHVNKGDKVALDILQEISSISQRAGAVDLITNERQIETRVTVADGETVVLGGLIKDNVIQSETRVPLLGSIPILGHLFRSQSTSVQKTNLLVFIRPTILRDDDTLRGATAVKYNFIRDRQLEQRSLNRLLTGEEDLPLLPEWEEVVPPPKADEEDEQNEEQADAPVTIDNVNVEVSAQ